MKLKVEAGLDGRLPKSFEWHGRRHKVISIGRRWNVDDEHFMLVMTSQDNIFELAFHPLKQTWRLLRTPQDFGKQSFV